MVEGLGCLSIEGLRMHVWLRAEDVSMVEGLGCIYSLGLVMKGLGSNERSLLAANGRASQESSTHDMSLFRQITRVPHILNMTLAVKLDGITPESGRRKLLNRLHAVERI